MVGLNFDTGKSIIKTDHYPLLGVLRQAFELFPASRVRIEGHTDAFGSDDFNQTLSEQRAKAVKEYMKAIAEFDANRLSSAGHGETQPAATTKRSRGANRTGASTS